MFVCKSYANVSAPIRTSQTMAILPIDPFFEKAHEAGLTHTFLDDTSNGHTHHSLSRGITRSSIFPGQPPTTQEDWGVEWYPSGEGTRRRPKVTPLLSLTHFPHTSHPISPIYHRHSF